MKQNSRKFYFRFVAFFFSTLGFAQLSSHQIDELVQTSMARMQVAGVAVLVIKDGQVVHKKGYGVKSIQTQEKVDEYTNFAIASNSKAFTSAALAILVDEKQINWTDPVIKYIPEFKMYNDYVTENFNIQDLLTHRSGLGLGAGDLMFFPDGSDFGMKDILSVFQYFEPQSAFRTQFDYDNLLYYVAGEIVARVSGVSFESFIEKRIFAPLGMEQTYSFWPRIKDPKSLASPHNADSGKLREISHFTKNVNAAPGGIFSNINDLSQWLLVQLNEGKYGDQLDHVLFSEQSQQEMWRIHTPLKTPQGDQYNTHFFGYGLGWFLKDVNGYLHVSHTGGLPGMLSKTVLIPDLNLGVVVLTNTEPGGGAFFSAVSNIIVDAYLPIDKTDWLTFYVERLQKSKQTGDQVTEEVWKTVASHRSVKIEASKYVGLYEDPWFGKVEVYEKGSKIFIKSYRSPKLNGQLEFYQDNTFAVKWEYQDMNADAFVIFETDKENNVSEMKMKGISPNIDFSFDFQDLSFKRIRH
ncbi:serine hydrolase [Namhaeicola litoreus]|uniref:Serine hydrolase n=1 Tax=Namhaeicola litoreus TaxID=1052145 RepID=A0ABW3Y4P0_9FLAO